jgi:hypothetical protein
MKLTPQAKLLDHQHAVAPGQHEELGLDVKPLVGDLWEHGVLAARHVVR